MNLDPRATAPADFDFYGLGTVRAEPMGAGELPAPGGSIWRFDLEGDARGMVLFSGVANSLADEDAVCELGNVLASRVAGALTRDRASALVHLSPPRRAGGLPPRLPPGSERLCYRVTHPLGPQAGQLDVVLWEVP